MFIRKMALISILFAIILILVPGQTRAEEKFLAKSQDGIFYYMVEEKILENSVQVLVKKVMDKKSLSYKRQVDFLKSIGVDGPQYAFSLVLYEINCKREEIRIISTQELDEKGKSLYKSEEDRSASWIKILPNSMHEVIKTHACKKDKASAPASPGMEWLAKGHQYAINKQYDLALEALNKAISIDPKLSIAYVHRGNVYDSVGQYEKSLEDYKKAIAIDPKNSEAYYERGLAHAHKGKIDLAIQDFGISVEIIPSAKAYYNRGLAYSDKNMMQNAIDDFTKAIQLLPGFAMAYHDRGFIYSKRAQYGKAIDDFTKAVSFDPNLAPAYYKRAMAFQKEGLKEKAISDLNKACDIYVRYGVGFAKKDNFEKAHQYFQYAIETNPDNPLAYYNMACLFSSRKNTLKACDYLIKAVDKGFNKWKVIKEDDSLANIRHAECYKKIVSGK